MDTEGANMQDPIPPNPEELTASIESFAKMGHFNRAAKRKFDKDVRGNRKGKLKPKGHLKQGKSSPSILTLWKQQDEIIKLIKGMSTEGFLDQVGGLAVKVKEALALEAPTIYDLVRMNRDQMLGIPGVGAGTVEKVRLALHGHGIDVWKVVGE